jgi:guanine deaminase
MNKYMKEALKEDLKGIHNKEGGPFGCVIVCKGKVIAKGHNLVTSSFDPTSHAEIVAIRKASQKLKSYNLKDCELYTTCEPCPMCFSAIHWSRIKKVYYACTRKDAAKIGFDDQVLYDILAGKKKENQFALKEIDRKDCLIAFKEWKAKKDKKMY